MQTIAFYTLFTLFFGTTKTFTHSVLLHRSSNGLKCQYTNTSFFSLVTVLNALNLQTFENVDSHPKCHGLNNYSKSKLNIEDEEEKRLNENKISTKMGNYVNIYQPAANFKWLFAFHRSITTMYNELYCVVKTRDFLCVLFLNVLFIHDLLLFEKQINAIIFMSVLFKISPFQRNILKRLRIQSRILYMEICRAFYSTGFVLNLKWFSTWNHLQSDHSRWCISSWIWKMVEPIFVTSLVLTKAVLLSSLLLGTCLGVIMIQIFVIKMQDEK